MTTMSRVVIHILSCDVVYYTPAIDSCKIMNEREVDDHGFSYEYVTYCICDMMLVGTVFIVSNIEYLCHSMSILLTIPFLAKVFP